MDWKLSKSVIRGEIDNRERDRVTGRIWLVGRDEPVELFLNGNCLRDIAGCRMVFENPAPAPGDNLDLATMQSGIAGDMTASRKIRYAGAGGAGKKTKGHGEGRTGNCLYLEWHSDVNGLIVLEGPDFHIALGEPAWRMTRDEEKEQVKSNRERAEAWLAAEADDSAESAPYVPMDEFEWERNLKESDAMTDRYGQVLEKYVDHPDSERLIAREMGWTWLMEALDEGGEADDAPDGGSEDEVAAAYEEADDFELTPNPLTEGVDWIRNDHDRVTHPLTDGSFKFAMEMWHYCKENNLIGEKGDPDIQDTVFQVQTITAKIAGALDNLAYDVDVDGGFIVACLKRTLPMFNKAFADIDSVDRKAAMDPAKSAYFRQKMLGLREEVLRMMTKHRKRAM